jgi:hypothetical protein
MGLIPFLFGILLDLVVLTPVRVPLHQSPIYFLWQVPCRPGLWIRIDLIRIRIQHFCSIRIRIQAKTELSKIISFSNFFELKI